MAKNVRERMVVGATQLLATKGLHGTSFSEVIELTGAPRGSIYHHFPRGKDELVGAALTFSRENMVAWLNSLDGLAPLDLLAAFFERWRRMLSSRDFCVGCAVVAVTVGTESDELRHQAGEAFAVWEQTLTNLWTRAGLAPELARSFSATLVAVTEGAMVLSRARHSTDPLDRVEDQMRVLLTSLLTSRVA